MNKLLDKIGKHPKITLMLILLVTCFFAYQMRNLSISANYAAFLPYGEEPEKYQGGSGEYAPGEIKLSYEEEDITLYSTAYGKLNAVASTNPIIPATEEPDYTYSGSLLVLIEADDLYQADIFNKMEECIANLVARREVGEPSSVFNFVTFEKKGTRLVTVPISTHTLGDADWTEEEVAEVEYKIKNDPNLKFFQVSEDANSILFDFPIGGYNDPMLEEFSAAFDPLREMGCRIYTNGGAVIAAKVMQYLQEDLYTLIGLCLAVMLITFFLCFRSKRSVLVPASLSIIGLIWTFGSMSMLGYKITLLNIVTPCMVLTLGSAYSIHVINEYYLDCCGKNAVSVIEATKKIIKTIGLAAITTICGFLCLCISKTDGLKEFGLSVSLGIFFCAVLAATYLPAVLVMMKKPEEKKVEKQRNGLLSKLIGKLSNFVPKAWIALLIILFIFFIGFILVKDRISLDSNYMSYFPASDPFGQESKHFANKMGGTNPFYVTIQAPEDAKNFFIQSENIRKVWEFENKIKSSSEDVLQVLSYPSYVSFANRTLTGEEGIPDSNGLGLMISRLIMMMKNQIGGQLSMVINDDASEITLVVQHWDSVNKDLMTTSSIARVRQLMIDNFDMLPDGTTVTLSGDPIVNLKFTTRLFEDQSISTYLSILIVFLIATLTFRSPFKGFYSIVPVVSGIFVNYLFMFFAGIPFDMITVSFTSIAVGCGVDDAIHFLLRYSNLRKHKKELSVKQSLSLTIMETGRPIILTTVSIVFGMMMLSFASYTPIRYFGLLMSVTLSGCMISTILFMPAMIIFGNTLSEKIKTLKKR